MEDILLIISGLMLAFMFPTCTCCGSCDGTRCATDESVTGCSSCSTNPEFYLIEVQGTTSILQVGSPESDCTWTSPDTQDIGDGANSWVLDMSAGTAAGDVTLTNGTVVFDNDGTFSCLCDSPFSLFDAGDLTSEEEAALPSEICVQAVDIDSFTCYYASARTFPLRYIIDAGELSEDDCSAEGGQTPCEDNYSGEHTLTNYYSDAYDCFWSDTVTSFNVCSPDEVGPFTATYTWRLSVGQEGGSQVHWNIIDSSRNRPAPDNRIFYQVLDDRNTPTIDPLSSIVVPVLNTSTNCSGYPSSITLVPDTT